MVFLERDTNLDGTLDYRYELVYDDEDYVTELKLDSNGDAELEEIRYYIYDCP